MTRKELRELWESLNESCKYYPGIFKKKRAAFADQHFAVLLDTLAARDAVIKDFKALRDEIVDHHHGAEAEGIIIEMDAILEKAKQ